MNPKRIGRTVAMITLIAATALPSAALARSYSDLVSQGYRIGPMTKSRGGNPGWVLTRGSKHYFCHNHVALALGGATGMVLISSSGRIQAINKKAFDRYRGGPDRNLPRLQDLKVGRVRPQDVGVCTVR